MHDQFYMELARRLALKGQGQTSPNPMVGAVLVKKGQVIATGWHKRCGGPHAEATALKQAGARAQGATLYVTLEPCHHHGRTPPCVDAVIKSMVREVVIGTSDPNPLTNGKSIRKLRRHGIRVRLGIRQKEIQRMNEAFEKYIRRGMPFVTAKIAQTLDGKIATRTGDSKWITSLSTRHFTRRLRNDFDAILVGVNTIIQDDPCLCAAQKNKRLKKIVLDSTLRIPLRAKMFKQTIPPDCIIATTQRASSAKISILRKKGVNVLVCPSRAGKVDLRWVLKKLANQEITSVLIEGGATVIGSALAERLVDKLHIFIAPKVLGDENGLSSIRGIRCLAIGDCFELKDMKVQQVGPDIFVEGYLKS